MLCPTGPNSTVSVWGNRCVHLVYVYQFIYLSCRSHLPSSLSFLHASSMSVIPLPAPHHQIRTRSPHLATTWRVRILSSSENIARIQKVHCYSSTSYWFSLTFRCIFGVVYRIYDINLIEWHSKVINDQKRQSSWWQSVLEARPSSFYVAEHEIAAERRDNFAPWMCLFVSWRPCWSHDILKTQW